MIETRTLPKGKIEVRDMGDGKKMIRGYAAVFYNGSPDTEYRLWDNVVERVDRAAFNRAVAENQDVRALFNHDPNQVLGRTSAGTCKLFIDEEGLGYEIVPDDTTVSRDVQRYCARGDVDGSSFSFAVQSQNWTEERGLTVRTLLDVDLADVGPVTFPAYTGTTSGYRAVGDLREVRDSLEAWKKQRDQEAAELAAELEERRKWIESRK